MNTVTARPDGTGTLRLGDAERTVREDSIDSARTELLRILVEEAKRTGAPVPVVAHEPTGQFPLVVHPDGSVNPVEGEPVPARHSLTPTTGAQAPATAPPRCGRG